ncbi:hypothetical protein IL306_010250 [Fusarium sp. DS 682]|nr:hypothetical protein IL306_010250 [Fusarium sp. DS 682]
MAGLLSLPPEMITEIGRNLAVHHLNSFSLVCRRIQDSLNTCHFQAIIFEGSRADVAEKLIRFLLNRTTSRVVTMGRVCRSLNIQIRPVINDTFNEGREYLPALIHSVKKKLPRVHCLALNIDGLSASERAAFRWQMRGCSDWNNIQTLKADVPEPTLRVLMERIPENALRGVELYHRVIEHRIRCIRQNQPNLRRLRIRFQDPLLDMFRYFNGVQGVKFTELKALEQLIIAERPDPANPPRNSGVSTPGSLQNTLAGIARDLSGLTNLKQLSIHYNNGILDWIGNPVFDLQPGQPARADLTTTVTIGITRMADRLPNLQEVCIVEKTVIGTVNLIYRGKRNHIGTMSVTAEAPGPRNSYRNAFPLGIAY